MKNPDLDKLVKLRMSQEVLADPATDIRGRKVIDINGRSLGKIHALLVDDTEKKVRFLEVESGGILGLGESKSFIPIDAITRVTDDEVQINQETGTVASAPAYDPKLIDHQKFFTDTLGYYGFPPFLATSYTYPSHPGGDALDRN
jgi:sporulation protein YlmC with PRC-barrel domain